jgi:hypothetical protein
MDGHFRPQHINLNYPQVAYDAVFFLENSAAITPFVKQICPHFTFATFAPHSREAAAKLRAHYDKATIALVQQIYAKDFDYFGYSEDFEDALRAPGALIIEDRLIPQPVSEVPLPAAPRHAVPGMTFEKTLRYRRLIDLRLV